MIKKILLISLCIFSILSCTTEDDILGFDLSVIQVEVESLTLGNTENLNFTVSTLNNGNSIIDQPFTVDYFLSTTEEITTSSPLIGRINYNTSIQSDETLTLTESLPLNNILAGVYHLIVEIKVDNNSLNSDVIIDDILYTSDNLITITEEEFNGEIFSGMANTVSLFNDENFRIVKINDEFLSYNEEFLLEDGTKITVITGNTLEITPDVNNLEPIVFTYAKDYINGVLSNDITVNLTILEATVPIAEEFNAEIFSGVANTVVLFNDENFHIVRINDKPIRNGDELFLEDSTKIILVADNTLEITPDVNNLEESIVLTYARDNRTNGLLSNNITVNLSILNTSVPIANDDFLVFDDVDSVFARILENDVNFDGKNNSLKVTSVNGITINSNLALNSNLLTDITLEDNTHIIFDAIANAVTISPTDDYDYTKPIIFDYTIENEFGLTDTAQVTIIIDPLQEIEDKDLITSKVILKTNTYTRLSQLEATLKIKNIGSADVQNFSVVELHLSKDKILDSDEDFYIGFATLRDGLSANEEITLSLSGGANAYGIDADAGTYYVIANTDHRSEVKEINENNNIYVSDYTVEILANDTDLTLDPAFPGSFSYDYNDDNEFQVSYSPHFINFGRDNFKSANYEYYIASSRVSNENEATKISSVKFIGFDWEVTASSGRSDDLGSVVELDGQYLFIKILDKGQEIRILDNNLDNNFIYGGQIDSNTLQ